MDKCCCMCLQEVENTNTVSQCTICGKLICLTCQKSSKILTRDGIKLCEVCESCYKKIMPGDYIPTRQTI